MPVLRWKRLRLQNDGHLDLQLLNVGRGIAKNLRIRIHSFDVIEGRILEVDGEFTPSISEAHQQQIKTTKPNLTPSVKF